jgi:aspartyl-tRNA(Asn)/glutamyl-tRNA(Gln) amidotransferase subunit C
MQVDAALISRLEKLARLQLSPEERERIAGDLTQILDMVDQLSACDTTDIEPLTYLSQPADALREDVIRHQLSTPQALQNAPDHDGQHFKVPLFIER